MAADSCDVETVVRRALSDALTVWYASQWVKKNPTLGIPCTFCSARNLPCTPRVTRIHCSNTECSSSSGGCSRLDEELFSRVKTLRPDLEREGFDEVLANIRSTTENAEAPLTLKIRRPPTRPYPSPISTPASDDDDEKDQTIRDLRKQLLERQGLILTHTEKLNNRGEELLRLQAQLKQSLDELQPTREKLDQEMKDKARLEEEVRQLRNKVSVPDHEKEDVGGAMLFRDLHATIKELQVTADNLKAERDTLLEEKSVLQSTVDILKADQKNRDATSASLEDALRAQLEVVEAEKDKLAAEKDELLQTKLDAEGQTSFTALADRCDALQREKDTLLYRNAELEDRLRPGRSTSQARDRDDGRDAPTSEKDKQLDGLKVQVATLQEQCETLRMEVERMETSREQELTVHLLETQLAVYKRKLTNARNHTVSVRTSSQRTFANVHLALTRLQHSLQGAASDVGLERAVKRHLRELKKLRERVEEETPGTVDAIMGMPVKREEDEDEDEDQDDDPDSGGGGEEEEEGRPNKRTRLNS